MDLPSGEMLHSPARPLVVMRVCCTFWKIGGRSFSPAAYL
jgi:hypothetical protein